MSGHSLAETSLRSGERTIGPGAQTSRLDDAGPVRSLLGGMASPAACSRSQSAFENGVERG